MSDQIQNIKIRFVADADFSDLDHSINKLTAEEKALKEQLKGVDEAAKSAGKSLNEESAKAHDSVSKTNKGVGDLKNSISDLGKNIPGAFQVEQIQQFGTQINNAKTAVTSLVGQMGLLKVAFAATGIGALIIALGSLFAYFKKTEQGSEALERGLAQIGAVVDVVIGKFANLGKGIVQLFSGEWKEAIETFRHSFDNIGSDIKNAANAANEFTTALQNIEDEERQLNLTVKENLLLRDQLLVQAKNKALSEQERLDLLKQAEEIEIKNNKMLLDLQQRKVNALREENALKVKNGELDEGHKTDELIAAEDHLIDLQSESLIILEKIQNREDALLLAQQEKANKEKAYWEMKNRYMAQDLNISKKTNEDELKSFDDTQKHKDELNKIYQKNLDAQRKKEEQEQQAAYNREQKRIDEIIENRIALKQNAIQLLTDIGNAFFNITKQNNEAELSDIQAKHDAELKAVGDNKQAQSIINQKYAKIESDLKAKQAKTDKEQALFNIGIQTLVNASKALGTPPAPNLGLAALALGIGAAQAATVAAKPLPKFNRGTKSVPGIDQGDDSIFAMLRPGEGVMPVDRMNDYRPAFDAIFDRKIPAHLLNSFVMDYGNLGRMISSNSSPDISSLKSELRSMNKKLDKLQILNVQMDQKGFKTYLAKENSKSKIENNYLRVG